ncbi:MAG: PF20097 family protein [Candidatus Thorarchaeota archaeon]|jgi:hypothetical protein
MTKDSEEKVSSNNAEVVCPVCGNPMEAGYMAGREGVAWKSKLTLSHVGENIFDHKYRVTYSYFAAHLCRQCGIIKYIPRKKL